MPGQRGTVPGLVVTGAKLFRIDAGQDSNHIRHASNHSGRGFNHQKQKNMPAISYVPAPDALFSAWLLNFSTKLTASPATYGLIAGDAVIVAAQNTAFQAAYLAAITPATRTGSTIAAKDAARATAESVVRPYAQRIKVNPAVSNAARVDIGVTVDAFPPTPIPAPTSSPVLMLMMATPLQHTMQYRDALTPTSKAKPYGVKQLALFVTVGVAPAVDPDAALYRGGFTKSPMNIGFESSQRGKVATYFARWENGSGPGGVAARGPWSDPVSVIII